MNKDTFIMRTKIIEGGEGVAQEILDVSHRIYILDIIHIYLSPLDRSCMTTLLCQNSLMLMAVKNLSVQEQKDPIHGSLS